ncbi:uncharacterized protein J7T54_000520 [Emericellopsis cladophorae]|uniref:Uncharacterized protein n=1 Tax=Emericellopsis cladophorae TaxID=2686198 RepID=A0A9Q0BC91_9HYPO|nr:uncharacterized protein J7T54_000520 [Emericellopsis cladophorae]KAI6778864.1 hypothetical protein J7T54_000520 [Emericellopsis cladophorae]
MGNNLSSQFEPDLSGVVLAPYDRDASIILGATWGIVFYIIAMIWSTCALIDRWKGPNDKIRTGKSSVVAALVLSTMWPVVVAYMMLAT